MRRAHGALSSSSINSSGVQNQTSVQIRRRTQRLRSGDDLAVAALDCIAAGVPILVEKPIADTVGEGPRLSDAAGHDGFTWVERGQSLAARPVRDEGPDSTVGVAGACLDPGPCPRDDRGRVGTGAETAHPQGIADLAWPGRTLHPVRLPPAHERAGARAAVKPAGPQAGRALGLRRGTLNAGRLVTVLRQIARAARTTPAGRSVAVHRPAKRPVRSAARAVRPRR